MSDDPDDGVLIGDASAFVRLTRRDGPRSGDGLTTTIIDVKGGPFAGTVQDDMLIGVSAFCDELAVLYDRLNGTATLSSYEKFKMSFEGDGRGAILVLVEIYGEHVPLSKLCFEMGIDQTFLPKIIRKLKAEFIDT